MEELGFESNNDANNPNIGLVGININGVLRAPGTGNNEDLVSLISNCK